MTTNNNSKKSKKSNVIYIDRKRNEKVNTNKNNLSKKSKEQKKNNNLNKNHNKEKENSNKTKNNNLKQKSSHKKINNKKNNSKKVSNNTKKDNNPQKHKSKKLRINKKIKIILSILLVIIVVFFGTKGVQKIMNKDTKSSVSISNTKDNESLDKNEIEKNQYDLKDEKKDVSKKYNIVIDAGHGGNDKGSIDSTDIIYEKDIALQIAKKVASRLGRESDVNITMTRTEDKYVSLEERAEIAKRANADALISIHLNAQKKFGDANGLETWYRGGATDGSKELAESVQQTTSAYIDIMNRGILQNNFEILRETTMPAVLVECGFITNVSDMEKIKNNKYQDMLAEGIMQGTLSFLDKKNGKN